MGHFPHIPQQGEDPIRQAFLHEGNNVFGPGKNGILQRIHGHGGFFAGFLNQNIEQVRTGDHPDDPVIVHYRQDPLLVVDDFFLDFTDPGVRAHGGELAGHILFDGDGIQIMIQGFFNDLPGNISREAVFAV